MKSTSNNYIYDYSMHRRSSSFPTPWAPPLTCWGSLGSALGRWAGTSWQEVILGISWERKFLRKVSGATCASSMRRTRPEVICETMRDYRDNDKSIKQMILSGHVLLYFQSSSCSWFPLWSLFMMVLITFADLCWLQQLCHPKGGVRGTWACIV